MFTIATSSSSLSIKTPNDSLNVPSSCLRCTISKINNTVEQLKTNTKTEHHSARVIQHFFKKLIAEKSYTLMFSNGDNFKKLGQQLNHHTSAINHLDKISSHYLNDIKEKVKNLTTAEQALLNKITKSQLLLKHQSHNQLSQNGILSISSNDRIKREKIQTTEFTFDMDKYYLSNHDFVFFSLDFAENDEQRPVSKTHSGVFYGPNCYLIEEQKNYGYLTLTDHACGDVRAFSDQEHKSFINQFPIMKDKLPRLIHGDNGTIDVPIFNQNDMKEALALHLINFIRDAKDKKFSEFTLSPNLTGQELDMILNSVFHPEYHIPRMISIPNFKHRDINRVQPRD